MLANQKLNRLAAALALCLPPSLPLTAAANAAPPTGAAFQVLDSLTLPVQEVDGIAMMELSDLAWDADEQLLYAVSDRGRIFHFRLELAGDRIASLKPVFAAEFRDPRNIGRKFNAEGLTAIGADNGIQGDTQLVVALENGPAAVRTTPRGEVVAEVELPLPLRTKENYRSKNKRIEAVAAHPKHGLIFAPEVSLQGDPATRHTLYATDGATWSFEALQAADSDVKAINALPDGKLLVLERTQAGRAGYAGLRLVDPASCGADRTCASGGAEAGSPVRAEGNFEGMTRLSERRFLLVADGGVKDGGSRFALIDLPAP